MANLKVQISELPEMLAFLRRELAHIIRIHAELEEPVVKARLLEYAAIFETGQTTDTASNAPTE